MDVHLRDLRYFVAVAEELHVTRAAERLFISQPALSKQLRAVERQLRVTLFEREPRGVRLTAAGAALLPHARDLIRRWDAAEGELSQLTAYRLVVGMSTGPGRGLLPAIRARLAVATPDARVEIRQFSWGDGSSGLATGDADAAFVWLPMPDPDAYACVVLVREPRVVALPSGHRLAARASLRLGDLDDEPFLALPGSAGPGRDYWLAVAERGGPPPRIAAEIASTEETYEAVTAGVGICLLAAGNAAIFERGGVIMRPVEDISEARLALAWRRDDDRGLLRTFVTAARAVAAAQDQHS